MTSLATLVSSYTRTPSATLYLDGRRWYGVQKLSTNTRFRENIGSGSVDGRNPPTTPTIGMAIRWTWGYNGYEVAGFTGEVADIVDFSYPDRWQLAVKDVLWRADKSSQVLQTSPLNDITAQDAVIYLLTHYGGISASRISIPALNASGSGWVGSEWILGRLTPVQWGDTDTESGGTTALKAAAEICSCLGYWLYADSGGIIRAKAMERRPSTSAREVFQRNLNLLVQGAPERRASYESIFNQATVRGANTGVDGAQLYDQFRTTHPLLPSGVYRDFPFSSFLLEYENEAEAGAASVTAVAKRILNVVSRVPDVVPLRAKADPNRHVGDTVGIVDTGIRLTSQKNFFVYQIDRSLDLQSGAFDDALTLDGGTGSSGFTTVPPPDASFSWTLMAETLDGTAVVEVFLDGSASTSPSGEIVSWSWSTSTPTYASTPNSATGVTATFIFEAADTPAIVTLTVLDTTSKTDTLEASVDLTGADTADPILRVLSVAFGSAWLVTPDGGATWAVETTNGDAVAVPPYGAGIDDRASGTAATYGLLATRGTAGVGVRQTLDALSSPSTNLASIGTAIRCMWVNEANGARVWVGAGDTVYRSTDGGATFTAMAKPAVGTNINWIIEDPSVDNSVFVACGSDVFNATAPTVGWALLYAGPIGATARQFVRSRDGQVTWIAYTGAPSGEALQRVENGAAADIAVTDIRSLALDRDATNLRATLYAATADNPAQLWTFDGLTGLSAVQSAETFPSGATVQHMLHDPDASLIYAADFNSVAVGTGAVRKWLIEMDRLLLMKAGATGRQAHMLGFGGPIVPPARVLRITDGDTPGGVWVYGTGGWALKNAGLPTSKRWRWIASDPTNGDRWLLLGNSTASDVYTAVAGVLKMADGTTNPLWLTTDAGVTWVAVPITIATYGGSVMYRVEWSEQDAGEWAGSGDVYSAGPYAAVWRGDTSGGVVTADASKAVTNYIGFCPPGIAGQVLAHTDDAAGYWADAASTLTSLGAPTWAGDLAIDRLSGANPGYVATDSGGADLFVSADYRTDLPALALANVGTWVALAGTIAYVGGRTTSGILQVTDPFGSPSSAVVAAAGLTIGHIRADRQTRTHVAAVRGGDCYVFDGSTWTHIAGPALSVALSDRIEIVVAP